MIISYLSLIFCTVFPATVNLACSKVGADKVPIALFENPYCSLGIPRKFLSSFLFPFASIKNAIAYSPSGISVLSWVES